MIFTAKFLRVATPPHTNVQTYGQGQGQRELSMVTDLCLMLRPAYSSPLKWKGVNPLSAMCSWPYDTQHRFMAVGLKGLNSVGDLQAWPNQCGLIDHRHWPLLTSWLDKMKRFNMGGNSILMKRHVGWSRCGRRGNAVEGSYQQYMVTFDGAN